MYASVEICYKYKPESWYKLWGGRIVVQITPLQDFGDEIGARWAYTPRWAYTLNFTVHAKLVFTVGKRLDSKCRKRVQEYTLFGHVQHTVEVPRQR